MRFFTFSSPLLETVSPSEALPSDCGPIFSDADGLSRQRLGRFSCYPNVGLGPVQNGLSNPAKAGSTLIPIYKSERIVDRSRGGTGNVCLLALSLTLVLLSHPSGIAASFFTSPENTGRWPSGVFRRGDLRCPRSGPCSYAANRSPIFSGVVCPVWIRHRSTARRRANATIAFFFAERFLPDSTGFHRSSGAYSGW